MSIAPKTKIARPLFGGLFLGLLFCFPLHGLTNDFEYRSEGQEILPIFNSLQPLKSIPQDVKLECDSNDDRCLYFDVRYGSPGSKRVLMVVELTESGNFKLFVDSNRDRKLEADEIVEGSGRERTFELEAEIIRRNRPDENTDAKFEAHLFKRQVRLRLNSSNDSVGFATTGYFAGTNRIGENELAMRSIDGNSNGLFGETGDRIWIDFNNDGKWSPFGEQFSFKPIVKIDEQRYTLKSDLGGKRLAFEPIDGLGSAQLIIPLNTPESIVDAVKVLLVAEDNSVFPIQSQEPIEIPPGKYTVNNVSISVRATSNSQPMHFVFTQVGGVKKDKQRVFHVIKNKLTTINPIGELTFGLETSSGFEPNGSIVARAQLQTEDGLLINSSHVGGAATSAADSNFNLVTMQFTGTDGKRMGNERCGFL